MQSYWEITSDSYLSFIKRYVVGIGPWKDTLVPVVDKYLQTPCDLVAKAHAHNLQVCIFSVKLVQGCISKSIQTHIMVVTYPLFPNVFPSLKIYFYGLNYM